MLRRAGYGDDEVVACLRGPGAAPGARRVEIRTFTASLEELAGRLSAEGVTEVVMEAAGQYWKPVWYV